MGWQTFKQVLTLDDLADFGVIADVEAPEKETAGQVEAGADAVRALVESGAFGKWESLHVHMQGHANPKHSPAGGQHDTVSVSVSVGKYKGKA